MKLKVKPEGRKGIYIPEKEDLKKFIRSRKLKQIHNFIPTSNMMLGADHSVKSVLRDIDNANRLGIVLAIAGSMNIGHTLSIISGPEDDEKLELYDIGKVTEDDLEIV